MRATMSSKGQITIPLAIRTQLGLTQGQTLEFDAEAPFLKAVPVFDEQAMRSVIGCATSSRPKPSSLSWLDETRGTADLPPSKKKRK